MCKQNVKRGGGGWQFLATRACGLDRENNKQNRNTCLILMKINRNFYYLVYTSFQMDVRITVLFINVHVNQFLNFFFYRMNVYCVCVLMVCLVTVARGQYLGGGLGMGGGNFNSFGGPSFNSGGGYPYTLSMGSSASSFPYGGGIPSFSGISTPMGGGASIGQFPNLDSGFSNFGGGMSNFGGQYSGFNGGMSGFDSYPIYGSGGRSNFGGGFGGEYNMQYPSRVIYVCI